MFVSGDPSTHKTHEMDPRRSTHARKAVPRNAFDLLTERIRRYQKREKTEAAGNKNARQKRRKRIEKSNYEMERENQGVAESPDNSQNSAKLA